MAVIVVGDIDPAEAEKRSKPILAHLKIQPMKNQGLHISTYCNKNKNLMQWLLLMMRQPILFLKFSISNT